MPITKGKKSSGVISTLTFWGKQAIERIKRSEIARGEQLSTKEFWHSATTLCEFVNGRRMALVIKSKPQNVHHPA